MFRQTPLTSFDIIRIALVPFKNLNKFCLIDKLPYHHIPKNLSGSYSDFLLKRSSLCDRPTEDCWGKLVPGVAVESLNLNGLMQIHCVLEECGRYNMYAQT